MNDYQKVEVKMMQEVVAFFDQNPELEKENTVLKDHVDLIRQILKDIKENEIKQNFVNTGYTENKKKIKVDLANLDVNITSSICSYASDSGKNELYNQFKVPISKVKAMSDADIVNYSNTTIVEAEKYKKELEPYNVTADELVELSNITKAYSKILLVPAQVRKEKTIATANIKKLIPQALQILKRSMDRDMEHYKEINVKVYDKYHRLRNIDDSQTTHIPLYGNVTNKKTGKSLQYVKVEIKFRPAKELASTVKTTTATGYYRFEDLEPNSYTIKFSLENYDTLEIDFTLHEGETKRLDVALRKTE